MIDRFPHSRPSHVFRCQCRSDLNCLRLYLLSPKSRRLCLSPLRLAVCFSVSSQNSLTTLYPELESVCLWLGKYIPVHQIDPGITVTINEAGYTASAVGPASLSVSNRQLVPVIRRPVTQPTDHRVTRDASISLDHHGFPNLAKKSMGRPALYAS